jgi:hypothetical protein
LRTGDGRALAPRLKAEIVREIKRLEVVLEMIATVEAERDAILNEKKSTHLNADKIKMLAKLKAIGAESRHLLHLLTTGYGTTWTQADQWRVRYRRKRAQTATSGADPKRSLAGPKFRTAATP